MEQDEDQYLSPLERGCGSDMTTREERFWAKVDVPTFTEDCCWLWTACCTKGGYGKFSVGNGHWIGAHRYAYELMVGPVPEGRELDHRYSCLKRCVNPGHLTPRTDQENNENHAGAYRNSKTGIRGVSWSKGNQKWLTQTSYRGRKHYGGYFTDLDEAEAAVIALRCSLHTNNELDREKVSV